MYKKFTLGLALLTLTSTIHAKNFSMAQEGISFDAPAGFERMIPKLIQIKYPRGNSPANVLTNKSTESTIAYDVRAKN